jgi:hypothetical protein
MPEYDICILPETASVELNKRMVYKSFGVIQGLPASSAPCEVCHTWQSYIISARKTIYRYLYLSLLTLSSLKSFTLMTLMEVGLNLLRCAVLIACVCACVTPVFGGSANVFRSTSVCARTALHPLHYLLMLLCSFVCPVTLLFTNLFPGC